MFLPASPPDLRHGRGVSAHKPNAKARGELAEAIFLAKAMSMGMTVSKPFGDNAPYDFIVDCSGKISRVQVKSCWTRGIWGYRINLGKSGITRYAISRYYRPGELDFFIGYVAPEDQWFVIPARFARHRLYVATRDLDDSTITKYRDAWTQLWPRSVCAPRLPAFGRHGTTYNAAP